MVVAAVNVAGSSCTAAKLLTTVITARRRNSCCFVQREYTKCFTRSNGLDRCRPNTDDEDATACLAVVLSEEDGVDDDGDDREFVNAFPTDDFTGGLYAAAKFVVVVVLTAPEEEARLLDTK